MAEMIAHLKDQLQEMKSKSNLESNYVKKSAENSLDMNSTLKTIKETELKVHDSVSSGKGTTIFDYN